MSDKEKSIIQRLSDSVQRLNKEKQNYILGLAEGMVIAKDAQSDERIPAVIEGR